MHRKPHRLQWKMNLFKTNKHHYFPDKIIEDEIANYSIHKQGKTFLCKKNLEFY